MSDMFICPTCKRPTHPTDNEIIEYLAKEIDRYTEVLIIRTKELDRTRKALDVAIDALKRIKFRGEHSKYECCKVSGIIAQGALERITAIEQKDE